MRTFGQVPVKLWRDKRYRAMTDDGKLAFISLWCGPQSTSAGVMRLEDGYAALALDWTTERWAKARQEIEVQGLIRRNPDTEEVLIIGFFEISRPTNVGARAAVTRQIEAIDCDELRNEAELAFEAVIPQPPSQTAAILQTGYINGKGRR